MWPKSSNRASYSNEVPVGKGMDPPCPKYYLLEWGRIHHVPNITCWRGDGSTMSLLPVGKGMDPPCPKYYLLERGWIHHVPSGVQNFSENLFVSYFRSEKVGQGCHQRKGNVQNFWKN